MYEDADAIEEIQELHALTLISPRWIDEVIGSYDGDSEIADILQKISNNPDSVPNYSYKGGILRFKGRLVVGKMKGLRRVILSELHASPEGGHSRYHATY